MPPWLIYEELILSLCEISINGFDLVYSPSINGFMLKAQEIVHLLQYLPVDVIIIVYILSILTFFSLLTWWFIGVIFGVRTAIVSFTEVRQINLDVFQFLSCFENSLMH